MLTIEQSSFDRCCVDDDSVRRLSFCLIGCEVQPPYGPISHTAQLFLDLLLASATSTHPYYSIRIDAFNAQKEEYPMRWEEYDGVLIPGSFSSAYDMDPWILTLRRVLQEIVVARELPTLGVCFGHQILAQSFSSSANTAHVTANPAGARAGRFRTALSPTGKSIFLEEAAATTEYLDLYYTHGDIVVKLPECAQALCADQHAVVYHGKRLFAVTFQAHPEYAMTMESGVKGTLMKCMGAQLSSGVLDETTYHLAVDDAHQTFDDVRKDSVLAIASVGKLLGWFT